MIAARSNTLGLEDTELLSNLNKVNGAFQEPPDSNDEPPRDPIPGPVRAALYVLSIPLAAYQRVFGQYKEAESEMLKK